MTDSLRVLLATSWGTACGIADHSAMLKAAVEAVDPNILLEPDAQFLDPAWALGYLGSRVPQGGKYLLHLNHHDALHSRWTPEQVMAVKALEVPVVVTYHDTRAGADDCPNSDKAHQLYAIADAFIVHEPCADIPGATYWRQGVPAAAQDPSLYFTVGSQTVYGFSTPTGMQRVHGFKAFPQQPILGTVGFNFPWKNYDRLCSLTADQGWALVLLANNATAVDIMRWERLNPHILVVPEFLPQASVVNYLAGCDATIFMYECQNTGTSGAIRQGLAARKPVIALESCRQFRDLYELERQGNAPGAIHWVADWEGAAQALFTIQRTPYDPLVSRLAHQEAWSVYGAKHAQLYRTLAEATR